MFKELISYAGYDGFDRLLLTERKRHNYVKSLQASDQRITRSYGSGIRS